MEKRARLIDEKIPQGRMSSLDDASLREDLQSIEAMASVAEGRVAPEVLQALQWGLGVTRRRAALVEALFGANFQVSRVLRDGVFLPVENPYSSWWSGDFNEKAGPIGPGVLVNDIGGISLAYGLPFDEPAILEQTFREPRRKSPLDPPVGFYEDIVRWRSRRSDKETPLPFVAEERWRAKDSRGLKCYCGTWLFSPVASNPFHSWLQLANSLKVGMTTDHAAGMGGRTDPMHAGVLWNEEAHAGFMGRISLGTYEGSIRCVELRLEGVRLKSLGREAFKAATSVKETRQFQTSSQGQDELNCFVWNG